jgi:DNA (cytosine-5)-methyltransferase 1
MKNNDPLFIVIDLFCGAGGTTTGFALAELEGSGIAKVIACVNHDKKAIKSHWMNHPEVKHFEEDIRTLELTELIALVGYYRNKYPNAYLVLWASLECTNFSNAKGGQPRDADSRTLANHLDRYIVALDPDYIQIENVVEFMSWGPLDDKGKPVSRKNGQDWMKWRNLICSHGYRDEWREMNSANYGAYTSRNRLFGVFARPWLPIVFPEPTHSKKVDINKPVGAYYQNSFGEVRSLEKWKAVKEVLDFEDEGESIFNRKKPLSDKTLERIYAGLIKYVAKGDTAFISKYFSGRPKGKVNSVNDPAPTVTTFGGSSLVQPISLLKYNSTNKNGKHIPPSLEQPCPVVSTHGRLGIVQGEFLAHYYGNGFCSSLNEPCPTLRTKDGATLVQCDSFIMPTNYDNKPKSIDEPAPTITANRKHHYIVNPSHGGHSTSTDAPCPVIVARQDKAPLYLVQVENGPVAVSVYKDDPEVMIRIKQFMAAFNLVDIKMRMLRVPELLRIQGFPEDYKLFGNQADQKKFIGNSVVPHVVKAWTEALAVRLIDQQRKVA